MITYKRIFREIRKEFGRKSCRFSLYMYLLFQIHIAMHVNGERYCYLGLLLFLVATENFRFIPVQFRGVFTQESELNFNNFIILYNKRLKITN